MTTSKRTFRMFVEEELGEFPHFLIGAVLEWLLIASLFIDAFLAFLSNKFAIIFDLEPPCVLCTRVDRSLNPTFYYNKSICESHKKDISSLAYCHVHKKLADIRNICETCLVSFAMDKETEDDPKKHVDQKDNDKDDDVSKDGGDRKLTLKPVKTGKEKNNNRVVEMSRCSCCGDPFKTRHSSKAFVRTPSLLRATAMAPNQTPRAPFTPAGWRQPLTPVGWRLDEGKNLDLPHIRYTELKFISDNESDMPDEDYGMNADSKIVRDDTKSTTAPLLADSEGEEESCKTPTCGKVNKYFGMPFAESAINSPRLANKISKKFPLEKYDLGSDNEDIPADGESIIQLLKRQLRADRRLLMALFQELNEERSASAVAANNSMAMITRLQTEKASIEMEALQYQRMMEEQAEYDQEAIQVLKDMLVQKEKDIKIMEAELEAYKEKYGEIKKEENEECEDDGYQSQSSASSGETRKREAIRLAENRSTLNYDTERSQLLDMLTNLENLIQLSDQGKGEEKEKQGILERELSVVKERLSMMEADSGFLKQAAMRLQKGDARAELLTEIAQHLRKLRSQDINTTLIYDQMPTML